jgi:hypothetical protein
MGPGHQLTVSSVFNGTNSYGRYQLTRCSWTIFSFCLVRAHYTPMPASRSNKCCSRATGLESTPLTSSPSCHAIEVTRPLLLDIGRRVPAQQSSPTKSPTKLGLGQLQKTIDLMDYLQDHGENQANNWSDPPILAGLLEDEPSDSQIEAILEVLKLNWSLIV